MYTQGVGLLHGISGIAHLFCSKFSYLKYVLAFRVIFHVQGVGLLHGISGIISDICGSGFSAVSLRFLDYRKR